MDTLHATERREVVVQVERQPNGEFAVRTAGIRTRLLALFADATEPQLVKPAEGKYYLLEIIDGAGQSVGRTAADQLLARVHIAEVLVRPAVARSRPNASTDTEPELTVLRPTDPVIPISPLVQAARPTPRLEDLPPHVREPIERELFVRRMLLAYAMRANGYDVQAQSQSQHLRHIVQNLLRDALGEPELAANQQAGFADLQQAMQARPADQAQSLLEGILAVAPHDASEQAVQRSVRHFLAALSKGPASSSQAWASATLVRFPPQAIVPRPAGGEHITVSSGQAITLKGIQAKLLGSDGKQPSPVSIEKGLELLRVYLTTVDPLKATGVRDDAAGLLGMMKAGLTSRSNRPREVAVPQRLVQVMLDRRQQVTGLVQELEAFAGRLPKDEKPAGA